MGWFGSKEIKKIRRGGGTEIYEGTNKQICELIGISENDIYEDEINSIISSLNEGDVIHFVMEITLLIIDNVVDPNILLELDVGDRDLDKFETFMEKATINEGEKYDGSGLVGALNDRLLIVMNGGKDKFDFAYNELNGISSYQNSSLLGQYIKIDRKNKGKDWTGNIYLEKSKGPARKSKEMWNGFNEWFPSHLKNLEQRKVREEREQEQKEKDNQQKERRRKEKYERRKERSERRRKEQEEKEKKQREKEEKRIQRKIARAQDKEEHLDYDGAVEIYEEIGDKKSAKRVRKLKTEEGKVKVDQTVVHGDYVDDRDTIVKDSVVNKSNISGGGSSKMQELKELKEMFDSGFISKEEMEDMKKEILGK